MLKTISAIIGESLTTAAEATLEFLALGLFLGFIALAAEAVDFNARCGDGRWVAHPKECIRQ